MKTIVHAQGLGVFKVEDENKLTLAQAFKEFNLKWKEWKLVTTVHAKTQVTYTVKHTIQVKAPAPPADQSPPDPQDPAQDPAYKIIEPMTGAVLTGTTPEQAPPRDPVTVALPRTLFEETLMVAQDFVEKKSSLPILTCVRLVFDGGSVTLSATDLECAFTRTIPATGGEVTVCVSAALLYSEVKALHENIQTVELTIGPVTMSVQGRCDIITSEADNFPEVPDVGEGMEVKVPSLATILKKVVPAASQDETRYALKSVLLDLPKGKVVATDGFRLHYEDSEVFPEAKAVILPVKAAHLIAKHGKDESPQRLLIGEKYLSCALPRGSMVVRLLEVNFPTYEDVMPTDLPITVTFDRKEFLKVLEGATPVAGSDRAVTLTVDGNMTVQTRGDSGTYSYTVPCTSEGKHDKPREVTYNMRFVLDAIRCYDNGPMVTVKLPASYGPTLINTKALVMPIRR
jgi:DNA polymerase III subunit beta